jgi:type IV secretion system protein VirB6
MGAPTAWTIFAWLFNAFNGALLPAITAMTTAMLNYVQTPLTFAVTAWLGAMTAMDLFMEGGGGDPVKNLLRRCVRALIVLSLVQTANYTPLFNTFVLTTLPNQISSALTTVIPNATAVSANAFDTLINLAWIGVTEIWKNLSPWNVKSIVVGLVGGFLLIGDALLIIAAFLVYTATTFLSGLAVVLGPLFVCFLLWEKTLPWFNSWLVKLVALLLAQVGVVALLTLVFAVENSLLQQVVAANATTGANVNDVGTQVHYLLGVFIVLCLLAYFAPKIPDFTASLVGHGAGAVARFSEAAHAKITNAAGAAARNIGPALNAITGGGNSSGGSVGGSSSSTPKAAPASRSITPPGRAP